MWINYGRRSLTTTPGTTSTASSTRTRATNWTPSVGNIDRNPACLLGINFFVLLMRTRFSWIGEVKKMFVNSNCKKGAMHIIIMYAKIFGFWNLPLLFDGIWCSFEGILKWHIFPPFHPLLIYSLTNLIWFFNNLWNNIIIILLIFVYFFTVNTLTVADQKCLFHAVH